MIISTIRTLFRLSEVMCTLQTGAWKVMPRRSQIHRGRTAALICRRLRVCVPPQHKWQERRRLTDRHVTGNSWALVTYVCVGPLISPRAGERDKLMAPLVDHKTANCEGEGEKKKRESEREKYTDRWRKQNGEKECGG